MAGGENLEPEISKIENPGRRGGPKVHRRRDHSSFLWRATKGKERRKMSSNSQKNFKEQGGGLSQRGRTGRPLLKETETKEVRDGDLRTKSQKEFSNVFPGGKKKGPTST